MSTNLSQSRTANFLLLGQKTADFRHQACLKHRSGLDQPQPIHWIAVVKLGMIERNRNGYPLWFAGPDAKLQLDRFVLRDADGTPRASSAAPAHLYDLSPFLDELLRHKYLGRAFFHLFIRETVAADGAHEVVALCGLPRKDWWTIGVHADVPWIDDAVSAWIRYVSVDCSQCIEFQRPVRILYQPAYETLVFAKAAS